MRLSLPRSFKSPALTSLSLPPGTRNGLGPKSSRRPRLLSPYSAFSAVSLAARLLYNTMPVTRSRLPPAPQVEVACSLWHRPVYPAGPGPANGRPPQRQGEGSPQDPSSGKGKGKGKEQNKGKPYASRARQDPKRGTCGEAERLPCGAGKEPANT